MGSAQVAVVAVGGGRRQTPSGSRGHHPQRSGAAEGNAWGEGRARLRGVLVSWARRERHEECTSSSPPPSCSVSASVVGPSRKPAGHGRRAWSASFRVRLRASGRGAARTKGIEPIPFTVTLGKVSHAWESGSQLKLQIICSVPAGRSGGWQWAGVLARLTDSLPAIWQGGALR